MSTDPVALTADLVRCPSVTPEEGGALVLLENVLSKAGFACTRVDRGGVSNLYARWGDKGHPRTFGFNGHTDVVPVGDLAAWSYDPFGAEIEDGWLYGRGATDMKSGVAAFAAAAIDFVKGADIDGAPDGAIVLAITGDEEGDALHGTTALLDWMEAEGERMDVCLVGEPTSPDHMGQMMKIGRRGSLTAWVTVRGQQGHAAYPHRAVNPLPAMAQLMAELSDHVLDEGTDHFDPSTLAVVTMDTGNPATNVIPSETRATVNIRFNDAHNSEDLIAWLQGRLEAVCSARGVTGSLRVKVSGESFVTPPGALSQLVSEAVQTETNRVPELSTTGGTSDARFVKNHCPVVEFGLVGHRMHAVDERVRVEQINQLKAIYGRILQSYFDGAPKTFR